MIARLELFSPAVLMARASLGLSKIELDSENFGREAPPSTNQATELLPDDRRSHSAFLIGLRRSRGDGHASKHGLERRKS